MRAGAVRLSTIQRHGGRLDAEYFLGPCDNEPGGDHDVERAEVRLRQAQVSLRKKTAARQAAQQRAANLVKSGEVIPIAGDTE